VSQRGIDAADEGGPVAVDIWCADHSSKPRRPLGRVRHSSAGLVFDARLPSAITGPPGFQEAQLKRLHDLGAGRVPIALWRGRQVILLEDPDDEPREVPKVECMGEVIELASADLMEAAARQASIRRPAKLVVAHSAASR
jgi:hypothetical protein